MAHLSQLISFGLQNARQILVSCNINNLAKLCVRHASKKSGTSTSNTGGHPRPKHRGWKVQDGATVQAGMILATQRTTRFHPGLHVGFGRNGTLFAIESGKVAVTCEKIDPNWKHFWVKRNYAGRENQVIYKKYFNVIPEPQHNRFVLIDKI
ncbi:PREDICTED: 39S ribosomal protein L27, mitochondrial [Wasmannia auropunctata]|uniref:39S ribosomal protein L27, mitochondrial n=1 Tax=Wasmannia auropunctata TaxID=64793 RepID=UPI0005EE945E|nr:PREDICTED: 39S ribosomal protein L27, mitochondrial [Wasmannia auropunctata]